MSGLEDAAKAAGVTLAVGASVFGSAAPDLSNTNYYADRPVQGMVAAAAEMIGAHADGEKLGEDVDMDGIAKAEAAETSDPPEGSTFAVEGGDEEADTDAQGEGDDFAAADTADAEASADIGDAFAAADSSEEAEAAEMDEVDAFSDDAVDGEFGDADGDSAGDADGDSDAGSDGGDSGL